MKIAMVQMKVIAGDVTANRQHGLELVDQAASRADVVLLPEIWTTGYYLKELDRWAETEQGETFSALKEIARSNQTWIIAGSVPLRLADDIYNAMPAISPEGILVARYEKIHMFSMYGESKYFQSGSRRSVFALNETIAGLAICYDLRFPELFRSLALDGAQIIFLAAEWPVARREHWRLLCQARAVENQVFIVAVNCVGEHRGIIFHGHSLLVSPDGVIVAEGGETEKVIYADIDPAETSRVRERLQVWRDRRPEMY